MMKIKEQRQKVKEKITLTSSMYLLVAPLMLVLAIMACGTAVSELAHYTCPTSVPPTAPVYLPGTAITPATVAPTPTPFEITSPAAFYKEDDVFVGSIGMLVYLRLRLLDVEVVMVEGRQLVTWTLEVSNLGTADFDTIPPMQMVISQLSGQTGTWRTSEQAMDAASFTDESYDTLSPNTTRTYRLAAFTPVAEVEQFTFILSESPRNVITWHNHPNPFCGGD